MDRGESGEARDDRMMALSKEERIPDRMMNLSKEERIELELLSGREGWSYCKIAEEFNLRHSCRQPIYFTAIRKLIKKFKETGSVLDKPRSGRPKTSDETKEAVEAKVSASPKKSLRRTSTVLGVP
ncbi:KEOPS complex subunit TP53RK isoform X1 [Octopus vulgaris]|uniref:KEOPS complex subunit TP53RK isoform X1 n=1 Tax=Octopus vulgaris TaxID=6645 RepID=A0AA36BV47_OCTVU|nr:KEOPS complex subunit TP53RK isoform X1 [Octopus vulgaris]